MQSLRAISKSVASAAVLFLLGCDDQAGDPLDDTRSGAQNSSDAADSAAATNLADTTRSAKAAKGPNIKGNGDCLPPPAQPWGGAQGICQCGFPELFCSSPAIACNDSSDCPNTCGGLPTCLLPGDSYPVECGDPLTTDCYYEEECACE